MVEVAPEAYPRFSDDMGYDGLARAIDRSVAYLRKLPEDRMFVFGQERFSRNHVIDSLERFLSFITTSPSADELNRFLAANYRIYRSRGSDGEGRVLFTGYYEPLIAGSLTQARIYSKVIALQIKALEEGLVDTDPYE